jgi:translation initiation factor 3 subunit L
MVDEFIYQYQVFCMYRAKVTALSAEDIQTLQSNSDAWSVTSLINILNALVAKSNINEQVCVCVSCDDVILPFQLIAVRQGQDPRDAAGVFGSRTLYKMLGYFSLVGLLRLHCLLGLIGVYVNAL